MNINPSKTPPKLIRFQFSCSLFTDLCTFEFRSTSNNVIYPENIAPGLNRCKSLRVWANFRCKSPRLQGGMVMAKIDSCISALGYDVIHSLKKPHETGQVCQATGSQRLIISKPLFNFSFIH